MQGAGNRHERKALITPNHPKRSVRRQCKLLDVNRNCLKKTPGKIPRSDTELVALIDEIYMECPFFRQRQLRNELQKLGHRIGRSRIRRLMRIMGIEALCPKPSTSKSSPAHKKYPCLLRNVGVTEVDQVWCTDITYIPMPRGHGYLVAIMDWHSRAVLAWEVRMDGKGRWMDNVLIERLWRSVKYEKLRLWSYETVGEASQLVSDWMEFYNHRRSHTALGG